MAAGIRDVNCCVGHLQLGGHSRIQVGRDSAPEHKGHRMACQEGRGIGSEELDRPFHEGIRLDSPPKLKHNLRGPPWSQHSIRRAKHGHRSNTGTLVDDGIPKTPQAAAVAILVFMDSPLNLKYGVVRVPPPIPNILLIKPVIKENIFICLCSLFV